MAIASFLVSVSAELHQKIYFKSQSLWPNKVKIILWLPDWSNVIFPKENLFKFNSKMSKNAPNSRVYSTGGVEIAQVT